jgi:hypothetical protein
MAEITLDQLRNFSHASTTLVIVDAPLFGVLMILNGRVLHRGSHEAGKVGSSLGFPPREKIVVEASRFWIVDQCAVRRRKTRDEMAKLLRELRRAAGAS